MLMAWGLPGWISAHEFDRRWWNVINTPFLAWSCWNLNISWRHCTTARTHATFKITHQIYQMFRWNQVKIWRLDILRKEKSLTQSRYPSRRISAKENEMLSRPVACKEWRHIYQDLGPYIRYFPAIQSRWRAFQKRDSPVRSPHWPADTAFHFRSKMLDESKKSWTDIDSTTYKLLCFYVF